MYAFLEGYLETNGSPIVLRVGGIGYELFVPEAQRLRLPALGQIVRMHTHLHLREDEMTLYGFASVAEREIFRALLSVNGVGPRVALAVLGNESAAEVLRGIRRGDPKPLLSIKGIGRKTAERVVLELEDKAAAWIAEGLDVEGAGSEAERGPDLSGVAAEATLALEALGVAPDRARVAVAAIAPADDADVEEVLRAALRQLHPGQSERRAQGGGR